MTIDPNAIYYSTHDGPYHIIADLGYYEDRQRKVLIRFDSTGYEQEARLYRAINGNVKDHSKLDIPPGTVLHSNSYGDFIYLETIGSMGTTHTQSRIKFILTGYECVVSLTNARRGSVRDPYYPSIYGVACLGLTDTKHPAYAMWHGMIRRCYDVNCSEYCSYGGIGIKVCDRWLCFENFLKDLPYIPGYIDWLENGYQIDKDLLQSHIPKSQRFYSPSTCCFISPTDNMHLMIRDNKTGTSCRYIGVSKERNRRNYRCSMTVKGKKYNFGTYTNPVAAAYVYNNKGRLYNANLNYINENLPYMPPEEIAASRVPVTPLIKIIDKDKDSN